MTSHFGTLFSGSANGMQTLLQGHLSSVWAPLFAFCPNNCMWADILKIATTETECWQFLQNSASVQAWQWNFHDSSQVQLLWNSRSWGLSNGQKRVVWCGNVSGRGHDLVMYMYSVSTCMSMKDYMKTNNIALTIQKNATTSELWWKIHLYYARVCSVSWTI